MKKIIITLAVLLLAAPVMADVTITCTNSGPNEVTVSFSTSGESELVRAIALDVQISDPCAWIEEVTCVSDYNIHPGSIDISPAGVIDDLGTCAGEQDTNSMTSEQGSLYVGDNAPVPGDLFIITLGGCGEVGSSGDVVVTVSENALRGGVVMEDADGPDGSVISDGITINIGECAIAGCATCVGDVDGNGYLTTADITTLFNQIAGLGSPYWVITDAADCGDVDQNGYRTTADITTLFNQIAGFGSPYWQICP